mgnify:CR=1 FL=1
MKQPTRWKRKTAAIAAMLCAMLLSAGTVYADTDGTEIQVAQPSQLEIQLGPQWAGVEFQMRTDAGLYPGVITVDETGVLRMEIGGSTTYTLSSMNSSVAVPDPEEPSQAPATIEPVSEEPEESAEIQETEEDAPDGEQGQDPAANVAGIPVQHLIFFGAGLVLAVGSLIALRFVKRRNASMEDDEYDDDDLPD